LKLLNGAALDPVPVAAGGFGQVSISGNQATLNLAPVPNAAAPTSDYIRFTYLTPA